MQGWRCVPRSTVELERDVEDRYGHVADGEADRRCDRRGGGGHAGRTSSTTKTISLTPNANLAAGGHYQVVASGLTDSADVVQDEPIRTFFTVAANGSRFTPIDPVRIFDSRDDGYPVGSGERLVLDLSAGLAQLPAAPPWCWNVTATQVTRPGNVRVFPTPADGIPPSGLQPQRHARGRPAEPGHGRPRADGTISLMPQATSTHLDRGRLGVLLSPAARPGSSRWPRCG